MERMWPEPDDMQDMVKANVLELLEVFGNQGHSGSSAPYVLGLFQRLADFKPLGQLTGEDDEPLKEAEYLPKHPLQQHLQERQIRPSLLARRSDIPRPKRPHFHQRI